MATVQQVLEAVYTSRFIDNSTAGAKAAAAAIDAYNKTLDATGTVTTRVAPTANQLVNSLDKVTQSARTLAQATLRLQQAQAALEADVATGGARQAELARAVETATDRVATAATKQAAAAESYRGTGAAIDALRAKYDPLYAAMQRSSEAQTDINTLGRAGVLQGQALANALELATKGYRDLAAAAETAAIAQRAAVASQGQAAAMTFAKAGSTGSGTMVASSLPADVAYAARAADLEAFSAAMTKARAEIDPLFAASMKYSEGLDAITAAQKVGAVSAERALALQQDLTAAYAKGMGPLEGFGNELTDAAAKAAAAAAKLAGLRAELDPLYAASTRYAEALAGVNTLQEAGVITAQRAAALQAEVTEKYAQANAPLQALNAAMKEATAAADQEAARLSVLQDKYDPVSAALQRLIGEYTDLEELRRAGLITAATETAAMDKAAAAYQDVAGAAQRSSEAQRAAIDPLYATSMKYASGLEAITAAQAEGVITAQRAVALQANLNAEYQKANDPLATVKKRTDDVGISSGIAAANTRLLGIQFIQAGSGIATGMPILTTLIQQGHQVADSALAMGLSFKDVANSAYSMFQAIGGFPVLIGVTAVAAMVGLAVSAERQNRALVDLQQTLRATRNDYMDLAVTATAAAKLVAATSTISGADAGAAAKAITSSGAFFGGNTQLTDLIRLSGDLAKVFGTTVPEAAKRLADALKDPAAAAKKLADEGFGGMSAAAARSIELLQMSGDKLGAQTKITDAYSQRLKEAAEAATPLEKAIHNLEQAFTSTGESGTSWSKALGDAITNIATNGIDGITRLIQAATTAKDWLTKNLPTISPDGGATTRDLLQRNGGTGVLPNTATNVVNDDFRPQLEAAAGTYGVDPQLLARLHLAEAIRKPDGTYQDSPTGPVGQMQVAPSTFRGLQKLPGGESLQGGSLYDAQTNANAGAMLFGILLRKYGDVSTAVLAYHDGEPKVDAMLAGHGSVSQEALDEARKVGGGYSGKGLTGGAPMDVSVTAQREALPTPPIPPSYGAVQGQINDAYGNAGGTLYVQRQDLAAKLKEQQDALGLAGSKVAGIKGADVVDLEALKNATDEYNRISAAVSKLTGEQNNLLTPAEAYVRSLKDQAPAANAVYEGDQKLIEVREHLNELERSNPGTVTPAVRAAAASAALELQSGAYKKIVADTELNISGQEKVTAAYGVSYAAVLQATAGNAAYSQALKLYPKDSEAQKAALAGLTEEYLRNAKATEEGKLAADTRNNQDSLAYMAKEASLITASTETRTAELAVFKARQEAEKTGIPISEAALQANLASVAAVAKMAATNKQMETSYTDLTNIGVNAFNAVGDAIVQAFTQGGAKAINFGTIFKGVLASVIQQLATLAVINPILNTLFGGGRSTLSSGLEALMGAAGASAGAGTLAVAGVATAAATATEGGLKFADGSAVQTVNPDQAAVTAAAATAGAQVGSTAGLKTAYDLGKLVFGGGGGQAIGTAIATALGQTAEQVTASVTNIALANATSLGTAIGGGAAVTAAQAAAGVVTSGAVSGVATAADLAAVSSTQVAVAGAASTAGASAQLAATAASTVSQAIPYIGTAITVITDLAQGNYKGAALVAAGAAIGTIIFPGIGTAIGAAIGGVIDMLTPAHPLHPYSTVGLTTNDSGHLVQGATSAQLVDNNPAIAATQTFIQVVNKFMDDVGIKLTNPNNKSNNALGGVGTGVTGFDQVDNPLKLFSAMRFTSATNTGSNFDLTKAGGLDGMEFPDIQTLQATLQKFASFSDGLDNLGLQLKSVGSNLVNIQIGGLKQGIIDAVASGAKLSDLQTAFQHDLPGQTFANEDAFITEITKINNFVNGTIPSLLNPVLETTSDLQKQIQALVHTYADAIYTSQQYGLATDDLSKAQGVAIAAMQVPALKALAVSNLGVLQRGQVARGESTAGSQLDTFDLQADQQRTALQDQFKNIYGSLIPDAKEYGAAAAVLDATLAAERLALVKSTNQAIIDAELAAARALQDAYRANQDASLSVFSAFMGIRIRSESAGGNDKQAEIDTYNLKAIDETKLYSRQLTDFYGASFAGTTDYHNRMSELETVQQQERLAIVKKYGDQISSAAAAAYANARTSVTTLIGSLADYTKTLETSDKSPLSPQKQYDLAKSQFLAVRGAAAAGDYNSATKLQGYSDTFLAASRTINGSGTGYANDFNSVIAGLQSVASVNIDTLTKSAMIAATQEQTVTLAGKLDELRAELVAVRRELQQQARAA